MTTGGIYSITLSAPVSRRQSEFVGIPLPYHSALVSCEGHSIRCCISGLCTFKKKCMVPIRSNVLSRCQWGSQCSDAHSVLSFECGKYCTNHCTRVIQYYLIYGTVVPEVYIRNSISIKTMYVSTVFCTSIALSGVKEKKVTA